MRKFWNMLKLTYRIVRFVSTNAPDGVSIISEFVQRWKADDPKPDTEESKIVSPISK